MSGSRIGRSSTVTPSFRFNSSRFRDWSPPEWFPNSVTRRQERRQRWPPFKAYTVTEKPTGFAALQLSRDKEISPLPVLPTVLEDTKLDVLKVVRVDLRIAENGEKHHTDKYDLMSRSTEPKLVIRRGQDFSIDLHFNRAFNENRDGVSFVFSVADGKPSMSHGTLLVIPLLLRTSDYWNATPYYAFIGETEGTRVEVQFKVSAKCPVGTWKIEVDTKFKERTQEELAAVSYKFKNPIYIICNPWCEKDLVYMEDADSRQEYILEDTGLIWRGTHNSLRPTPWTFSQFEADILDCAFYLLSVPGRLSPSSRADPVKISRVISAVVNSNDNNGVLIGNWTDKFEGGTRPSRWTGSAKILQTYFDTKKPVKFAQCWVFSGVLTTIARTLGIPSRPVTNYASAHDTDSSLTIDYFMDDDGKALDHLNTDSVWNFHVWNEVWMKRIDIGDDEKGRDYSGWQVVDATPQEMSDEVFRCGPSSVAAIRRGEILRPYDGAFVFSEVNADKLYWHYRGPGAPLKLLGKKSEAIGMNISTKAVGKFEREDITDFYKYPENTAEEREAMLNALKQSESLFSRYYLNEDFNDVRFDFELLDDIVIGSPFKVTLRVEHSRGFRDYKIRVSLRVDTMLYTGKIKAQVKKKTYDVLLAPGTEEQVILSVGYEDYAPKLCDQCSFNVACLAKVHDTNFEYFAQDDFRLRKPDIKFMIHVPDSESIFAGEAFKGVLRLKNPLPVKLTKCQFQLDSPGLSTPIKISLKKSVEPGEFAEGNFTITPKKEGEKTLSAKFTSKELEDVDGFVTITVNPSNSISP